MGDFRKGLIYLGQWHRGPLICMQISICNISFKNIHANIHDLWNRLMPKGGKKKPLCGQ